jgi:hypothetical protein
MGCGGAVTMGISDGSVHARDAEAEDSVDTDGVSPEASADSSPTTACPPMPPLDNDTCVFVDLECEYGANPNVNCNQLFTCTMAGWAKATPGEICPPSSDCPASYASVSNHETCPMADAPGSGKDLECAYPDGTCICSLGEGGTTGQPAWSCIVASTTCQSSRPRLGSPCEDTGTTCDYGGCGGGIAIQCNKGIWQITTILGCPP